MKCLLTLLFGVGVVVSAQNVVGDGVGQIPNCFTAATFDPTTDYFDGLKYALGDIERAVSEFLYQGSGWRVLSPLF